MGWKPHQELTWDPLVLVGTRVGGEDRALDSMRLRGLHIKTCWKTQQRRIDSAFPSSTLSDAATNEISVIA